MHTYTLYNSTFTHTNPNLSPVHHMRCDLNMCKISVDMLTNSKVVKDIKKFPTQLCCVLTEIPEISFTSDWGKGGSAVSVFTPITKILNTSTLGKAVQLFAGYNNIPLIETNEFSQKVMKSTSRATLKLKFTIYTDTYNNRTNFGSTPYETWLRMLYFSTAPIYKATYANLISMIENMATNIHDNATKISNFFDSTVEGTAAFTNVLTDSESDKKNSVKVIRAIKEITSQYMELKTKAYNFGHICWDIVIPGYLNATDESNSPIRWNVENFNVKFSDKFTRGIVTKDYNIDNYRPRPLYAEFEVMLKSNQIMTREQYINLLFGDKAKITKQPTTNSAP